MRKFTVVMAAFLVFGLSITFAEDNQSSTEKMVSVPESMLTTTQKAQVETKTLQDRIALYGKWVGLGKEVGEAVNGSLQAVTSQAVGFSNTKLGLFIMLLVAWKVMGTDLIQLLVGLPLLVIFLALWTWSYYQNCIPHRALIKTSKEGVKEYEVLGNGANCYWQWGYVCVLLIAILVDAMVLFL